MSVSRPVEITSTKLPLNVLVDNGRTGLSGLVAVRDASTAGTRWLDFADLTFKASGWTTRQAILSEVDPVNSPGLYHLPAGLNMSLVTNLPGVGSELIAEYSLSGVSPTFQGYAIDTYLLVDNINSLPTAATIADAVWDETMADHLNPGSTGLELQGKAEPGDDMSLTATTIEAIADALLDELLTGHFISDSVGEALTLIRGLVQQNYMVDSTVFNAAGLMTSARFRIFQTDLQVDSATDGGVGEGEIATFTVDACAEPSNNALLKFYKVTRD